MPAEKQARSIRNAHRYLDALKSHLNAEAHRPWEIVSQLLADSSVK